MTAVLGGDKRAAMLRAARGERATGPVPQGIRVVATTASEPPTTQPTTDLAVVKPAVAGGGVIEQLLARAEGSTRPRVRALVARIRALLAELESRLVIAAQEIETEQRVAQLQQQLAEAEQKLRTLRRSRTSPAGSAGSAGSVSTDEAREARKWALANGVECNTAGRVPTRVIEAWRAATAAGTAGGGSR